MRRSAAAWLWLWMALGCGGASTGVKEPTARADEQVGETTAVHPEATPEVSRAETMMAAGDFQGARSLLAGVVDRDPTNARGWFDLGFALEELGEPQQATRAYRKAIDASPRFAEPHNNLSVLLRESGALHEALSAVEQALKLDARFADAHLNKAMLLEDLHRADEARTSYERAIALAPNDMVARVDLGFLELHAGQRDKAIEHWRQAQTLATGDAGWLTAIGSGYRKAGDTQAALRVLQQAERLAPRQIDRVWSEIALTHYGAGQLDEAAYYLRKALSKNEDDVSLRYALGAVLLKKGASTDSPSLVQKGRTMLEDVIKHDPDGPYAARARRRLKAIDSQGQ